MRTLTFETKCAALERLLYTPVVTPLNYAAAAAVAEVVLSLLLRTSSYVPEGPSRMPVGCSSSTR